MAKLTGWPGAPAVGAGSGEAHDVDLRPLRGGVTAPRGFLASGVHAGLKRFRPDLALLVSSGPCQAAGVFTTNRVKAAPVLVTQEHLLRTQGRARVVVANSGNANACTGPSGVTGARAMAAYAAGLLGVPAEEVLVASTGVIGVPLHMPAVISGIEAAVKLLSREGGSGAAQAILTTDTRTKEIAYEVELTGGRVVRIGGMAKGSGMIHPNMGTMLAFLTTDAPVPAPALRAMLGRAVDRTFNMITVDGDTSTNDMVIALANGLAGGESVEEGSEDFSRLAAGIEQGCTYLAKEIARDGEGASRLIEVRVVGARCEADARLAARAIAGSSLVKTAVHGGDPNWGRVAAAAGYSGAEMDPTAFRVFLGAVAVADGGQGLAFDEPAARAALMEPEVQITIDLGTGKDGEATAWSCDLGEDYVKINASYRS